jgi:DNA-3-methyladenine glycosylase
LREKNAGNLSKIAGKKMILPKNFFNRDTLKVAQELLGCILVRKIGKKVIRAVITEAEAYKGKKDLASHASKGRTPRTELMFGEAGRAYIYLIYGMYYCLNIVTEKKNYPAAVLIRGVEIIKNSHFRKGRCLKDRGICKMSKTDKNFQILLNPPFPKEEIIKLNGPGKVCRELKIGKELNGWDMATGKKLWIESGKKAKPAQIQKDKRVGVDYAQHCKEYLWRFYFKE